MDNTDSSKNIKEHEYVNFVLDRMKKDTAFGAALRRADNPATEYQSWEYLIKWCDLDKNCQRLPYTVVSAGIARAKPDKDGFLGVGKAIAECYEDKNQSDSAKAKLRRLLACDSVKEACSILRPLLSLIGSRGLQLCYGQLLHELLYFGDGEKIKIKWAMDFYGRRGNDSVNAQVES